MRRLELRLLAALADSLAFLRRRAPIAWSGPAERAAHRLFLRANDRFMRRARGADR